MTYTNEELSRLFDILKEGFDVLNKLAEADDKELLNLDARMATLEDRIAELEK